MAVRFDTSHDAQLNLADRKHVAIRLLRLLALQATKQNERDDEEDQANNFISELDLVIDQTLRQHYKQDRDKPVDRALATVHDGVQNRLCGQQPPAVEAGVQSIRSKVEQIVCAGCSAHDNRVCAGTFRDFRLFEDGKDQPGGLCVGFVRDLAGWLRERSEVVFQKYAGGAPLRDATSDVVISMGTLADDHDGTLPMDGSFDPEAGCLNLRWPVERKALEEAILLLPYLIFHEVFVHGGQGRALPDPIDGVPPQCAFTEGAVDAAARRFLTTAVLGDDDGMPEDFIALRSKVMDRTEKYGVERNQMPTDDESDPVRNSVNRRIRRARAEGNIKIWKKLEQIESLTKRPGGWAIELMIRLNLFLDTDQRDEFVFGSEFWNVGQQAFRDDIAVAFDEFLESNNTLKLFDYFERIKLS